MEETLIKAFNCADSLPRCCFIWHLKVGRAALRSPPWARCSPWGGKGTDPGFHLPLFPGTLAFNESCSCSSTADFFRVLEGRRREREMLRCLSNNKKTPTIYSLRQLKSSLINGPVVLAWRSQVLFTWRLPGDQSSFPFCQSCPACPDSLAEHWARASGLGKRTRLHKSPPEN